jgi:hypothetical protein
VEFENGEGGVQCFDNKKQARKIVVACNWVIKNGRLRCDNCLEER